MKKIIINATPHTIRLQNSEGQVYEIASNPVACKALTARPVEVKSGIIYKGVEFVETLFEPAESGWVYLQDLAKEFSDPDAEYPDPLVVGSMVSAQAYGFPVVSMVPVAGFERVPPEKKVMRDDKFNVFRANK